MQAGAPSQAGILREIFNLDTTADPRIAKPRKDLEDFLFKRLKIKEKDRDQIALEDIYTSIDRCISDGTSLKGKTYSQLDKLRGHLELLISRAIESTIERCRGENQETNSYIKDFAEYLVKLAAKRSELARNVESADAAKSYDPFSIISLNWDTLLDYALHSALLSDNRNSGDYDPFGVVDYCCYISSFRADDTRIRSGLWSLGCRGYNVKLLKPHGSLNWLQCPNCQRLFVSFDPKLAMLNKIGKEVCRHCLKCGHRNTLRGALVMPTFLKDLSNFQIKLVWQNTGVELMEATRLVFIGYSLPYADFEFRQLLTRMVHPDASVEVVLRSDSDEAVKRYEVFFSGHEVKVHPEGVAEYVQRFLNPARTDDQQKLKTVNIAEASEV